MTEMPVDKVLSRLKNVEHSGDGYTALCPAHDDRQRSLSVGEGNDGRALLHCHAGCTVREVVDAVGLKMSDLFPKVQKNKQKYTGNGQTTEKPKKRIAATYDYVDENGKPLFQAVKFEPKGFAQRQKCPDPRGHCEKKKKNGKPACLYGWHWDLDGVTTVLYRLPEVIEAVKKGKVVYLVEGEKDADNLRKLGLTATTVPMGAEKWRDYYGNCLEGAKVAIIPDNDKSGWLHAEKISASIYGKAAAVKIVDLGGLNNLKDRGWDISDWLSEGGTKNELQELVVNTPQWEPGQEQEKYFQENYNGSDTNDTNEPEIAAGQEGTRHHLTDLGNVERFIIQVDNNLRYHKERGKWLHWNGKRWEIDDHGWLHYYAEKTVRSIYREAADCDDSDMREKIVKWAIKSEAERLIRAFLKLAQERQELIVHTRDLDKNHYLLNCLNGTIDLKTGKLREHRREDFITKLIPIKYDSDAKSEIFEKFLERILPRETVRSFVQRAAGYSITGDRTEEKFFFAYGPPAAGKSTLLEAIRSALDGYSHVSGFETYLKRQWVTNSPRPDLASLVGKRFVMAVEAGADRNFDEELLNHLTGENVIRTRHLYQEEFEFEPACKLWFAANDRPGVSSSTGGIWRRLVQISFNEAIPENERDPEIKLYLRDPERGGPAVLAWLVQGCLEWQKQGLDIPEEVKKATEDYKQSSDKLNDFIMDRCVVRAGVMADNMAIYKEYLAWAKEMGEKEVMGRKHFTQQMKDKGFDQIRSRKRRWVGIGIASEEEQKLGFEDEDEREGNLVHGNLASGVSGGLEDDDIY